MTLRVQQVLAAVLALSALVVGGWATFMPRSFFDGFPWPGRQWVSLLGPFNEHLVRDVGTLYLALLVVTAGAVLRPQPGRFRLVGLAWLVFGVPHLLFHLHHLEVFPMLDRVGMLASLGGTVLLAVGLLCPGSRPGPGRGVTSAPPVSSTFRCEERDADD